MKRRNSSARPQAKREAIRIELENKKEYNEYYRKVSSGYKVMKFLTVAGLLLYLIIMMCIYRSEITYDNLMYLVKDLDTDVSVSTAGFADISFVQDTEVVSGVFKNRLIIADTSKVTFYNTAGAAELESRLTMENPAVLTSEKYAMVYDVGGTGYSMYTTIAKVLDKNTEYEIQAASLSDSGSFAVATRARENRYVVDFFNENFKEVSRVYKDKYVMDVAIDSKGKSYAIVSTDIVSSDFVCEVMIGTVGSEEAYTTEIAGALPLSVKSLDNSGFAVICDNGVYFFSQDGAKTGEYLFGVMSLRFADSRGGYVLAAGGENLVGSASRIVLLDSTGAEVYKASFNKKINGAVLGENYIFAAFEDEISRISFDGSSESAEHRGNFDCLVPFADNVVVCTRTGASMGIGGASENTK